MRKEEITVRDILERVDHTLLAPEATAEQIDRLCLEAVKYSTASVCVPASYVGHCAELFARMKPERTPAVCTVIGFPSGYSTTASKCFEARDAQANGADEIDMVINIGWAKDARWDELAREISGVRAACEGSILKVIIETAKLTDDEKIKLCGIVSGTGADYIKTSTGFGGGGATAHDIELFAANIAPHLKIKAAGGIASLEDARLLISLGASRLGTSRIVRIVREAEEKGEALL